MSSLWASQLLTEQPSGIPFVAITADFTSAPGYNGVKRVEVVMFNCPQWGISAFEIIVYAGTLLSEGLSGTAFARNITTSCESLVRICIPDVNTVQPVLSVGFRLPSLTNWVHLAEIEFHSTGSSCPEITTTTGNSEWIAYNSE